MFNFQKELENISVTNAVQFKLFLAMTLIDTDKTRTTVLQIFLAVFPSCSLTDLGPLAF